METSSLINWKTFKSRLLAKPELTLQFQYADGKWVDASYHITEIKQAPIVSVDCGGVVNSWTEIVVQLWEPEALDQERAMTVGKALSIIDIVEKRLPLNPNAVVKIEFGNSQFDTRQMYPRDFLKRDDNLIVDLQPDFTQCKAISRGGSCGTNNKGEECCTPTEKPVVQLKMLAVAEASCKPGSGCC
ncbi:DUF6428 family protein [Hufsiella ginkgonis]|uniref:Uncharacterized protein n=1 Tax=Hufsiella ginkgonis TaxID=2695274 RepID=A0A7K1Y1F4_9SPHI|nr:DUF6428 family protein [Hufsiella ginkgonis]MXV16506.1 hypothetical protein [Hufsiella ginkgonis]